MVEEAILDHKGLNKYDTFLLMNKSSDIHSFKALWVEVKRNSTIKGVWAQYKFWKYECK